MTHDQAIMPLDIMRVITGKFKGRRLRAPAGLAVRPTGDRVKESLFNILAERTSGSTWLDLFAGTGAMGIEALSRGACRVVFVESQPEAYRALEYNIAHCRIQEGCVLIQSDIRRALRQCQKAGWTFNIIFLDPPYQSDLYETTLNDLAAGPLVAPEGLVIAEHHRKIPLRDAYGPLRRTQTRTYGTTEVSIYQKDEG